MTERKRWEADRWTFSVEEVSNGVWVAVADDQQGDQLRVTGADPDDTLRQVKTDAAEITERRRSAAE